ncbi:MAG TPA: helix-turn-helix domain-containing protein, partial [Gemmatimonadales bacterium]|nr:helix-turn-helix domain-containing protein [Gemmatimonadales bacterium]
ALLLHDWPGNVRQLARVLTAALARIGPEPSSAITAADLGLPTAPRGRLSDLLDPSALQAAVAWAITQTGGSRTAAAELLDVHRNTFAAFTARAASLA